MINDSLINKVQDLMLGSATTLMSGIEDKYVSSILSDQHDSALAWYYLYPQFRNSLEGDEITSLCFKNGIHVHKINNTNYVIAATFKVIKESFYSITKRPQCGYSALINYNGPIIYYSKLKVPYYLNTQDDNSYNIYNTINGYAKNFNDVAKKKPLFKNCFLLYETRVIFIGDNAIHNREDYRKQICQTSNSKTRVCIFGVNNKEYNFYKKDILDYDLLNFEYKDFLPYAINEFYDNANCNGLDKVNILLKSSKNSIPAIEFIAMIYNSKSMKTSSLCMYEAIQEYNVRGSVAAICKMDHLSYDKQLERIRNNASGLRFYITEEDLDEVFEFDAVIEIPEINRTIAEAYCDLFEISYNILDLLKFPISHKTLIEYIVECKIKRQ